MKEVEKKKLAYVSIMEAMPTDFQFGGLKDSIPVKSFRPVYNGTVSSPIPPSLQSNFLQQLIANVGYTLEKANDAIQNGYADAIAFGQNFISNPDLPERFKKGAALATPDYTRLYVGGEKGYTDYPTLKV